MSLLIPLLPVVTEVAAGLTMGITNAVRGEKSGFTLQIGNKVFTNTQPFPLNGLPFEIRSDIMLMALENSKQRNVLPNLQNVPLGHPFRDPNHYLYQHPANPFHPDHVNMAGEMMRNDYPISAWRWTTVSREWWAVLRQQLWSRLVLRGPHAYKGFLRLLADPDSCFIRDFVRTVVLGEGAESTFELYSVIRELPRMDGLIFRPWNPEKNLEPFGIHIVSTDPGPMSISFPNIPFDRVTNESTRKHLLRLPRLARLDLRLDTLSLEIGHLFASLPHLTHLSLRLPSLHPAQLAPLGTAQTAQILGVPMTDEETSLSDTPGQLNPSRPHLQDIEITALIIHDDVLPELRAFLAADSRLGPITTIYRGTNRELIYAPEERAALALELSEAAASASSTMGEGTGAPRSASGEGYARGMLLRMEGKEGKDSWQRTTSIRLFGGLINLRMESQK